MTSYSSVLNTNLFWEAAVIFVKDLLFFYVGFDIFSPLPRGHFLQFEPQYKYLYLKLEEVLADVLGFKPLTQQNNDVPTTGPCRPDKYNNYDN